MFFKKKQVKNPLLMKENIRLNCEAMPQEQVIEEIGKMLVESGYVKENYIEAMKKRELTFSTHVGNGIAMPHGIEEAKKEILNSGIAVMVFPNGTMWGENEVKLVVGIAGVGEEHLEILGNIAMKLGMPEDVEALVAGTVDEVYNTLSGEE